MILVINTNSIGYGEISNTTLNEGKNLANKYRTQDFRFV